MPFHFRISWYSRHTHSPATSEIDPSRSLIRNPVGVQFSLLHIEPEPSVSYYCVDRGISFPRHGVIHIVPGKPVAIRSGISLPLILHGIHHLRFDIPTLLTSTIDDQFFASGKLRSGADNPFTQACIKGNEAISAKRSEA
ncbi:MAG: hypothetical protein QF675_12625 [SAR324 cluster bacterium]|nr:hypothetical protein [SAR324 cluster bacterium]